MKNLIIFDVTVSCDCWLEEKKMRSRGWLKTLLLLVLNGRCINFIICTVAMVKIDAGILSTFSIFLVEIFSSSFRMILSVVRNHKSIG